MTNTDPIRNEAEYEEALGRISDLMDALSGPNGQVTDANHPARVEMDALVSQVEYYEDEHYPIDPPSPEEAIEFALDQTGKAPHESAARSERSEKVS